MMIVTLIADYKKIVVRWAADLSSFELAAIGTTEQEIEAVIAAKGHEGADVAGWVSTIS